MDSPREPSLLMLNDDVLLNVFKFLKLDDTINLAETCVRLRDLAQLTYIKFKTLTLNGNIVKDHIDRIFSHIGPEVVSLEIECYNPFGKHSDDFRTFVDINKIVARCKNMKRLLLSYWKNDETNANVVNNIDVTSSLEQLKLIDCDFSLEEQFLRRFRMLKYFSVSCCTGIDFNNVFENNTAIETFAFYACQNFLPDLKLLPKLNRVCLCLGDIEVKDVYSLLRLEVLTKLKLCCRDNIMKNFLFELATKGTLQELEIEIYLDEHFINMLSLFKRLEILIINAGKPYQLKSSINWPPGLKALLLTDFNITYNGLISMIHKLKSLQCIDISYCAIADSDKMYFSDVTNLGQQILKILEGGDEHKLDIFLPRCLALQGNASKKYEFQSGRLRITDSNVVKNNLPRLQKYFPDIHFYK